MFDATHDWSPQEDDSSGTLRADLVPELEVLERDEGARYHPEELNWVDARKSDDVDDRPNVGNCTG